MPSPLQIPMQGGPTRDIVPSRISSTPTRLNSASPAKVWLQQPEPAIRQQPSSAVAGQPASSISMDTLQPFSAHEDPAPPRQSLQEPQVAGAAHVALEPKSKADAAPTSARDAGAISSMAGGSSSTPPQRSQLGASSAAAPAGPRQNTSGTCVTAEAGQEALPAAPPRGRQDALGPESVLRKGASPAGPTAAPLAAHQDAPGDGTAAALPAARHGVSGATAAAASPEFQQDTSRLVYTASAASSSPPDATTTSQIRSTVLAMPAATLQVCCTSTTVWHSCGQICWRAMISYPNT